MKNFSLTPSNRRHFDSEVDKEQRESPQLYVTISKTKPKKASASARAVYHTWYEPMADHLAMTIPEATNYIKLTFGLPILFANKDFGVIIHAGLESKGFFQVSYERQLAYMKDFPVTRLFTTKMHNRLRDELQNFFGAQGLALEYEK